MSSPGAKIVLTDYGVEQCARRVVTATVVSQDGRHFIATNHVRAVPPTGCPRVGLKSGVGWHLCKEVCGQQAHAEVNALALAGEKARGGALFIEGHDYICDDCRAAAARAGIARIVVSDLEGETP